MSDIRVMTKQSSHYFLAYALSMVASFVTFPIYTRLFSVSDYGVLNLISATVFFIMAAAKLGVQNSIIRFFEDVKQNTVGISLHSFYSTLTFGPMGIIAVVCLLYALAVLVLKPDSQVYFLLSAVWIFFMCSNIIIKNFLRAEQKTGLYNVLGVAAKYLSLLVGVALVTLVFRSLMGLFLAFIITEIFVFVYLLWRLRLRERISLSGFNFPMVFLW
jgi:O-antigen/teichoic acid export membrane protein